MTNFIAIAKTILTLFPAIIAAVQAIEAAVPESGAGAVKLGAIKETLQAAYTVAGETLATFETVWPALSATIGTVVSLFNATGAFKKAA